jgi:hypothetical protein
VVSPKKPREQAGIYWGYSVRMASGLNGVFNECPYKEGYDVTVGTSERGQSVYDAADEFPSFSCVSFISSMANHIDIC